MHVQEFTIQSLLSGIFFNVGMLFTIKIFVLELMSLNVSNKDSIDRSERLDTNETREKNTTPVATSRFTEKQ